MPKTPEALTREAIGAALTAAGWVVQDMGQVNLSAGRVRIWSPSDLIVRRSAKQWTFQTARDPS